MSKFCNIDYISQVSILSPLAAKLLLFFFSNYRKKTMKAMVPNLSSTQALDLFFFFVVVAYLSK